MRLLEYKSISNDVVDLSNYVGNAIINDAQSQEKKASKQTYQYYKENTFQITVKNFLKDGNLLTVNYIMYFFKTEEYYKGYMEALGAKANSEADEETNSIKIVSAFIGNDVADDFYETIYHELEHLYQYGIGMAKRKSLYEKAIELLKRGHNDINGYYVGLCCYFSFKHEQDAFVHQFYAQLKKNGKRDKFENLTKNFQPYQNMKKAYVVLIRHKNEEYIMNAINYLGFSRKKFINLVKYRYKRFEAKMLNAYNRFMEETTVLNENNIDGYINKTSKILNETNNGKDKMIWSIESTYQF